MHRHIAMFLCILACSVFAAGDGIAKTWLIRADGTGDCPHLNAAVDSASAGDTLLLAPGTYTGAGNRTVDFGGTDLVVMSQSGPENTVIDLQANNTYAFRLDDFETSASVITGLTITNADFGGAGVINTYESSPVITGNIFLSNMAISGGAIYTTLGTPTIENNVFDGNSAEISGGALYIRSAAIIRNNTIFNNSAGEIGGAIFTDASPHIVDNLIYGNSAVNEGGALYVSLANASIEGNTIVENSAPEGSAIYLWRSTPTISKCIIAYNDGGAAMRCHVGFDPQVDCTLFFGNVGGSGACGIDNGGILFEDPQLCGITGSENFFPQSDSPCAPANNSCSVRIGARDPLCATVDSKDSTWGAIKTLFGSN